MAILDEQPSDRVNPIEIISWDAVFEPLHDRGDYSPTSELREQVASYIALAKALGIDHPLPPKLQIINYSAWEKELVRRIGEKYDIYNGDWVVEVYPERRDGDDQSATQAAQGAPSTQVQG